MIKEGSTSIEDFHQSLVSKLGNLKKPPVPSSSPNKHQKTLEIAKPLQIPSM